MPLDPLERTFVRSLVRCAIYFPLCIMALIAIGCYLADYFFWA